MSSMTNEPPADTNVGYAKRAIVGTFVTIRRTWFDPQTRATREERIIHDGDAEMARWLNENGYASSMMHFNLTHNSYDLPQTDDEKNRGIICRQTEIVTKAIVNGGVVEVPKTKTEEQMAPPGSKEAPSQRETDNLLGDDPIADFTLKHNPSLEQLDRKGREEVSSAPKTFTEDEVSEIVRSTIAHMRGGRF